MKKPKKNYTKRKSDKKILRKHPLGGFNVSTPLQQSSITQPSGNVESVSMGPAGPVVGP